MSYPYFYYGQGATFYQPQPYVYAAPAPAPTAAPKFVQPALPAGVYAAKESPSTTADLGDFKTIFEQSKPFVDQTEALANEIFPNDGAPIIQDGVIRTKYGEF